MPRYASRQTEKIAVSGNNSRLFKERAHVHIAVYKMLNVAYQIFFSTIFLRFGRKQYHLMFDQIVVRRIRHQMLSLLHREAFLKTPGAVAPHGKQRALFFGLVQKLDDCSIVEHPGNGR